MQCYIYLLYDEYEKVLDRCFLYWFPVYWNIILRYKTCFSDNWNQIPSSKDGVIGQVQMYK